MNKESCINNNSFVIFGIDKITLGVDRRYLNYRKTPNGLENIIDIITYGNWSELNIQWEYNGLSHINIFNPLDSVLRAILYGISLKLFIEPLSTDLYNYIKGIYSGYINPNVFINKFFPSIFKLDEFEIYFDFYGYNPFLSFNKGNFSFIGNSIYTKDYKKKMLHNKIYKRVRRSLLCFYNRGLKINSSQNINRLEFRICDYRAEAILNPFDLLYPLYNFIEMRGLQIKKTLKRYIPHNSIVYNGNYIEEYAPLLKRFLWVLE
jgi:hypothetical protein